MKRFRRPALGGAPGQLDKALLIGLGLLLVVLVRWLAPEPAERPRTAGTATALPVPSSGSPALSASPGAGLIASPTPAITPTRTADPPYWRVSSGGAGVNMRAAPSTSAQIVLQLDDGQVVTNLDETRSADGLTWRHVAYGDIEGWIAAELLQPQHD
ncbi:MAG: SH3 domain-containing protein [Chloroflexi bacterium]|nr:SH3 domain-containing protein [Chloroflexota bacterium]